MAASPVRRRRAWRPSLIEVVLAVLCIALALGAPGFGRADNLLNVLRSVSMQGIIALGMTMAIIAGEIDLSVGSAVAFAGCLCAKLTAWLSGSAGLAMPLAVTLACLASLGVGTGVGAASGWLRNRYGVPTFIITLAWMTVLKGAAELITNGFPLTPFPEWFNFLGGGRIGGVPVPALVFVGVFALVWTLMHRTTLGRAIYAVGGNVDAARLSGLNVGRVKIAALAAVGLLAALGGVLQASQIMSGSATTAVGWELDVISAVIIGGTSLMGGSGTVRGTLVGVIFLGVLVNGMTLLNYTEYWQHVVRGGLILAAVLVNTAPAGRTRRRTA
ncbi:MAG: ABC transporter permease [Armatimonadetes bacterium]|nr:ABC transporter permease [Armatimonadota bacterium]